MSPSEQVARASACALAMQEAMNRLCQTWVSRGALGLQMRIGIHHGRAVVGNFGSQQRSDYTAIGPSVNLASRIETACEPGEVYVSDEVCALIPEGTTTQEVGSFSLKGIDGDTRLHRLVSSG